MKKSSKTDKSFIQQTDFKIELHFCTKYVTIQKQVLTISLLLSCPALSHQSAALICLQTDIPTDSIDRINILTKRDIQSQTEQLYSAIFLLWGLL